MAKRKSTKRIKKAASKRKPSKKARGKSNAAKQGWLRSMVHYLGLRLLLFGLLSCGAGSLWLNWQSDRAVDGLLSRPIWAEPGQVTGGTVIRTGLAIDAAALSGLLRDAGYSWVDSLDGNHEFVRGPKSIIVRVDERDTLVTFDDSGVSSVSPDGVLQVEGIELAGTHLVEGPIRDPIEKADVPKHLVDAILAMEDSRFYEHPGVDALGIIRALISNMISENGMQGGSTLTQQLAKNLFLTPERTLERKVRELFLAISIEKRLSKDAILELYLNQVYLGQVNGVGIGGVDQGARTYFGVRASRLNLAQAATLAGIISAPNRYSPIRHPEEATKRRNIVLKRMVDLGLVDPEMAGRAGRTSIRTTTPRSRKKSPWAVDYALEVVEGTLGADSIGNGALRIQTTIDPALQMVAERSVKEGMEALGDRAKAAQVALVAIDPSDGNVLAMVGGRAYGESSFNRAVHGRRQIGSTVKAFSWLFAYDHDPALSPTSLVPDEPISIVTGESIWEPRNYDGTFAGDTPLWSAMAKSRNVPAVHVAQVTGFEQLSKNLEAVGLPGSLPYPSTSLGAFDVSPIDLCAAYTVFPGMGRVVRPRIVRSVRLPNGTEGYPGKVQKWRVASAEAAFLVSQDLRGVVEAGTGTVVQRFLSDRSWVAGKTGTTDQAWDSWFVGFTGNLVVAVWVGHDKGKPLGLTGAQAAAPIWARFVSGSGRVEDGELVPPETIQKTQVCSMSHETAVESCDVQYSSWSRTASSPKDCSVHSEMSPTQGILERLRRRLEGDTSKVDEKPIEGEGTRRRGWFRRRSR